MVLVHLRSVPESVGGGTQSLIVMPNCSFSLGWVVVGGFLLVPVSLTVPILNWPFFLSYLGLSLGDLVAQSNLNFMPVPQPVMS